MKNLWTRALAQLPAWAQELLDTLLPVLQVLLILVGALLLQKLIRHLFRRLTARYTLPDEFHIITRRMLSFMVFGGALLMALERLGVSSSVLWGAFTSFAAVGAVAFFAAWSVLSNVFCSLLIFTTRLLRLNDYVEVLEGGDKPGLKGRVVDINLIYTTLQETGSERHGTLLKVPNSLLFQRTLRQWRNADDVAVAAPPARPYLDDSAPPAPPVPPAPTPEPVPATTPPAAAAPPAAS